MNSHHETPTQDIEPRRDRGTSAADGVTLDIGTAALSAGRPVDKEVSPRIAIYLIEREAIEFRRQRWRDPYLPHTPDHARHLDARLAKYGRPEPVTSHGASDSRISKVGSWLKSLFRGE